ncbi:hypothetical protein Tsubulata_022644 [Turnera subulata]|uniref:Thioredoxin domain-containing protein n=1 Tax=Turnera subulata TaxID=218843 RepID=A0A9Q0G8I6_9ROSI|nr:hypothetical protein Tsubulata_022644 [Turnera subulata]
MRLFAGGLGVGDWTYQIIIWGSQQIIINFSASWSTPCRSLAKDYFDLADKYSSIIFLTVDVDVDELPELSTSWEIKATPTFFFLKEGGQVDKLVGADKAELQKKTAAIFELISAAAKS